MEYPRDLRSKERDLLESVLPAEREGYRRLRERVASMVVLGQGRRGAGDLVLGMSGDEPDVTSPLPAVIAYGMVETTRDTYSVTVRDEVGGQINAEIVSRSGDEIPDHFEEKRRWTYSRWEPGLPSPATGAPVRLVAIDPALTLALSPAEKRLWVHDAATGIVHLIPITNYYNELMLQKQIRDPDIALHHRLFWERVDGQTDADLRAAFIAYNRLKHRVEIRPGLPPPEPLGFAARLKRIVGKVFIVALVMFFAGGCEDKLKPSVVQLPRTDMPSQESWRSTVIFSDSARTKAVLWAGHIATFDQQRVTLLSDSVHVDFFNTTGGHSSLLTARRGKVNDATQDFEAYDNVVVVSDSGTILRTERLFWTNAEQKIHTDAFVDITSPTERIMGHGMVSDQGLKNYRIFRVTGQAVSHE